MKNYQFILWDIDDTLIDFKASEAQALRQCFYKYDITVSDEDLSIYSEINRNYWEQLAQGKVEKKFMLLKRFEDFLVHLGASHVDASVINDEYQEALGDHVLMYPYGMELCKELQKSKKQYAVTNGTIVAQNKKLKNTGLVHVFDGVFISDEVGYQKPDIRFFNHCFSEIPEFDPSQAIIIGDSLSSDMRGAMNAGIDSCWFNPRGEEKPEDMIVTYEIKDLKELEDLLLI